MVDPPSVSLSFANNFWGKEDAGVSPILERMHNAKVTGDELKSFYTSRAAIEDEYARKLLSLARKPLGSSEAGTLRMSLDVIRGEVESMGKAHQNVATQMKSELEEPLAAFTGGMKERRKIVQAGIEKLLKVKTQQTMTVNKTRDRYEQDCLKIKGYLAQGHMVMGQEERKNKAKLEKTQIQLSTTSNEYDAAVKILEETTGKWNRDWKAGCDKFQDLEEERIDFMKSSLWSFANIASTVCVTDDASCEKVRLSLEDCDVEKDIMSFIKECGTGQEIPDPPKFINFCRGDINDAASEVSDDGHYSVAQFQRTTNPAFRSSSPQPSTVGSHRETQLELGDSFKENVHPNIGSIGSMTQRKPAPAVQIPPSQAYPLRPQTSYQAPQRDDIPEVPHNEYPMDGMTQFCRLGPPSERSSAASPVRPASRDSQSEYSNPTSFSSQEPSQGSRSPTKQFSDLGWSQISGDEVQKKRSGFFQNRSPFRRKSKSEKERPQSGSVVAPGSNQNWAPGGALQGSNGGGSPTRQTRHYGQVSHGSNKSADVPSPSPEPADPRANFQLNVGNNVFDVASPDARRSQNPTTNGTEELDPIAKALAELKGLGKQSSVRMSADRYHGVASPGPGTPNDLNKPLPSDRHAINSKHHGAPPPTYDQPPVGHLGAPQPAFTSRQMQQTTQRYLDQSKNMFNPSSRYDQQQGPSSRSVPNSRPGTQGSGSGDFQSRATSPAPMRSTSPRPGLYDSHQRQGPQRAMSPNPQMMAGAQSNHPRPRAQSSSPVKGRNDSYGNRGPGTASPSYGMPRAASPQPQFNRMPNERPASRNEMAMQLAPVSSNGYPSQQAQHRGRPIGQQGGGRPVSQYVSAPQGVNGPQARTRSRSVADGRQFTKDGVPILHYSRAMYVYQAAIKEELSFAKGDVLAVLHHQDDGWWDAELVGGRGMRGLVPSNYLVDC